MVLTQQTAKELAVKELYPALMAEREILGRLDRWYRWDHDAPHVPRESTIEYRQLAERAQAPWLGLVVTSVAQALYVDGYRRAHEADNTESWRVWQANGMNRRQIAIHRAALAYGLSYATVLPGRTPLGEPMPTIRGHDPADLMAFYVDPAQDEYPAHALRLEAGLVDGRPGYVWHVYDDERIWRFHSAADGTNVEYVTFDEHNLGVCPVVRYANMLDLRGRSAGEVEPYISVASRIDQTTFDRLVVQRFSSWVVRTIAGMAKPETAEGAAADKLRLRVEDILIAADPDTKFGTLPATPLAGFIEAHDADVKVLAAVSQTPAHELLGMMANLSAEALAAARASLTAKVEERRTSFGESHEQVLRLCAWIAGDATGAADYEAAVRWRDTEIRSLAQAADALGKMATMLQVPVEVLWEKLPGFTQTDVDRMKALLEAGGGPLDELARMLTDGATSPEDTPTMTPSGMTVAELDAAFDALGKGIRSGANADDVAARLGLAGLQFSGVPSSVRVDPATAAELEPLGGAG